MSRLMGCVGAGGLRRGTIRFDIATSYNSTVRSLWSRRPATQAQAERRAPGEGDLLQPGRRRSRDPQQDGRIRESDTVAPVATRTSPRHSALIGPRRRASDDVAPLGNNCRCDRPGGVVVRMKTLHVRFYKSFNDDHLPCVA